jgi:hypothetical protein
VENSDKEAYRKIKSENKSANSKRSEAFKAYTFRKGEDPEVRLARIAQFK